MASHKEEECSCLWIEHHVDKTLLPFDIVRRRRPLFYNNNNRLLLPYIGSWFNISTNLIDKWIKSSIQKIVLRARVDFKECVRIPYAGRYG